MQEEVDEPNLELRNWLERNAELVAAFLRSSYGRCGGQEEPREEAA
jgi:hypothetical protein